MFFLLFFPFIKTKNWAVIVSTSVTWQNYRHTANALTMYQNVKRLGIPSKRIILMLADDVAMNIRNPFPGKVYGDRDCKEDLARNVLVDYRNKEVTPKKFLQVMLDISLNSNGKKRLLSDNKSKIFLYMTGHGVESYLNFREYNEISSNVFSSIFLLMEKNQKYKKILFIVDTCEAHSLFKKIKSSNIIGISSSRSKESSYSYHNNRILGLAVIDQLSFYIQSFMKGISNKSEDTLQDLFLYLKKQTMSSIPGLYVSPNTESPDKIKLISFFSN